MSEVTIVEDFFDTGLLPVRNVIAYQTVTYPSQHI